MNGFVFDFDGPIFDGRAAAQQALEATNQRYHERFQRTSMSFDQLPLLPPRLLIALMYAEAGLEPSQLKELEAYYGEQLDRAESGIVVRPEIRSLLRNLREMGGKLAILSSRRRDNVLCRMKQLGLDKLVDLVHGWDSVVSPKPSPEALVQVARELGCATEGVVFIGDSESDFRCARDAAVIYYHVAWSGEPCHAAAQQADGVFKTPADMVEALSVRRSAGIATDACLLPDDLREAITNRDVCFYAGSGISVPSGIGDWQGHYRGVMQSLGAGYLMEDGVDLPELLQLLAAQKEGARRLFEQFRSSFDRPDVVPNSYHYAMLRARPERIWTSNYDMLFEQANASCAFGYHTITNDRALLEHFRSRRLVVKMNGDFASAAYSDSLDWDVVFTQEQFDLVERQRPEIWRLFEDDYRNRCLVFVGVSFRDAALHRIVAIARQKIPRTRYNHYLLARRSSNPLHARKDELQAENLLRQSIHTIFFSNFAPIERFVAQMVIARRRPIVGFGGSFRVPENATDAEMRSSSLRLVGGSMSPGEVSDFGSCLGEALAERGYRVTSGCSPVVGIPPVSAAFRRAPTSARFYLRTRGGSVYAGTAPTIVIPLEPGAEGDVYRPMRRRFISELSLLIACGGTVRPDRPKSGVIEEIGMAMAKAIPVLIVPQVGGQSAAYRNSFLQVIDRFYPEPELAGEIRTLNDAMAAVGNSDMVHFAQNELPDLIEALMCKLVRCSLPVGHREASDTDW